MKSEKTNLIKKIKNKTNGNYKNKDQIWYKIKWTKILGDEIENII
jgi:hypothetical protein